MADAPESAPEQMPTVFTPISSGTSKLEVRACYFRSPIELELIRTHYPQLRVVSTDPLVLAVPGGSHVVVLPFGAVIFWQCSMPVRFAFVEELRKVLKGDGPEGQDQDMLVVLVEQPEERVNFRDICLKTLTLEHVRVISEAFGRSVALKHCELRLTQALKKTTPIVQAMEARGAFGSSEKDILKTVGFTLAVRDAILSQLRLFDDPVETLQSERLSRLHELLYDHFDMKKRLSTLQEKTTFLADLNQMLLALLQNRRSHQLEWIVILLIVIEVIFSFISIFTGLQH